MTEDPPGPILIGLAIALAVGVAGASWSVLSIISRPAGLQARLAGLEQRVNQARVLASRPPTGGEYAAHAICAAPDDRELASLRRSLETAATPLGLQLASLDILPSAPPAGSRLTPVQVSLEADGGYDAALSLVGRLARVQPQLFVDNLHLISRTSSVTLKLTGKVYCWTPAA